MIRFPVKRFVSHNRDTRSANTVVLVNIACKKTHTVLENPRVCWKISMWICFCVVNGLVLEVRVAVDNKVSMASNMCNGGFRQCV